jgi:hypothetical protein
MTVSTYIGTSGWHYDQWVGAFYSQDLPDGAFFEYGCYVNHFGTAEINAMPGLRSRRSLAAHGRLRHSG